MFAKDSINLGIMVTYRQKWEPQQYQVGDLVSTIPLAPKEIRRYTTRSVTKKTRAVKELEDNLQTRKTESSDTTRADGEIVKKAQEKTHFNLSASETFGSDDSMKITATQSGGGDSSKESAQIKKEMREVTGDALERRVAQALAPALSLQMHPLVAQDGGSTASWRHVAVADGIELHVRNDSPAARDDVLVALRETLRRALGRNDVGS